MLRYILADLRRNLRRTLTTVVGVSLGVGLFCGVLFFIDVLTASMTQRSVAALTIDMQRVVQGAVSIGGALAGIPVGVVLGAYFVRGLQPLFVLSPPLVVPLPAVAVPSAVAIVAASLSAVLGHRLAQRLEPAELLRDA